MKVFKFKFTKITLIFIYIGLALAAAAFAVNTYFVFAEGLGDAANSIYPILRYTLMYLVSILLFVVLASILFSSYYSIDGNKLKMSFGIIKSKYDIDKITTVILDRKPNKLAVYFEDETFITIAVKEEWYGDFTDALLKANPKIEFSIKSKENDIDENDKKNP